MKRARIWPRVKAFLLMWWPPYWWKRVRSLEALIRSYRLEYDDLKVSQEAMRIAFNSLRKENAELKEAAEPAEAKVD